MNIADLKGLHTGIQSLISHFGSEKLLSASIDTLGYRGSLFSIE